ncbi:hypothetical protein CRE_07939 [Caenorhabditis remanei]|uniref:CX domain-containing protein n=1 Tax=Caenorhabditis remanei TaxID=31234 RepID=E3NSJ5_CAERE|nr:hypothetical protein CRE_07939 [Caenorhabditis remanei]
MMGPRITVETLGDRRLFIHLLVWAPFVDVRRGHPLKCEYQSTCLLTKSFKTSPIQTFEATILQFGCLNYEDCCGLECCGDSRTSTVLICGIFLFLLATCVGYKKYQRYQIKKNDEMAMVTTNSALQPLLDDTNIEVHAV